MSKCGGVFGVARSIWGHPLFAKEPFSPREAWLWLISEAKYRSGLYRTPHAGLVFLDRGELCHAESHMAEVFGWNKSRVHRFLGRLVKADMIDRTAKRTDVRGSNRAPDRTGFQVISIRNYNEFQVVSLPNRTEIEAPETEVRTTEANRTEPDIEPHTEPLEISEKLCTASDSGRDVGGSEPEPEPASEPQLLRRLRRVNGAAGEPPSAAQESSQRLWGEGLETLSALANLGEPKARGLIGRWLSRRKGYAAGPENVLRAIREAVATGTPQPVPYIEAILKNESGGVRRDGDEWLIPHGTEEYRAHRQQLKIANSPEIYRWPDTPGHVARARSRWPMRAVNAA